jgi:hypothetical protein
MKRLFSLTAAIFVCAIPSIAQVDKPTVIHLENVMSVSEFKASGLNKLTPSELASLDSWLTNFTHNAVKVVTTPAPSETSQVIESEIDGEFKGWSGETIFKLTNGQIWQQAEYDYTYEYAYMPKVTIFKTSDGYKMKVEDVDDM